MKDLPASLLTWLNDQRWGAIKSYKLMGGGSINNTARVTTEHGPIVLVKTNPNAPTDMFSCEANGLQALARVPFAPKVPKVLGVHARWIVLEFFESAEQKTGYFNRLGEQLAILHASTAVQFGFHADNFLGSTPQPNPWTPNGHTFYAQQRLIYQAQLARKRKHLTPDESKLVEQVAYRLPELIPNQPASLLHGDLWHGNHMVGPHGQPILFDPAVYYGWAEAELAMTALFGGFSRAFYQAYAANAPQLAPDWAERIDLYNLYHLLNHLNLFGASYHGQVLQIAKRFA